jgi:N4-gp56 family major capsid protein
MLADTRPVQVDKPGSSVALYQYADLAVQTTPLNELTDPEVIALGNPTATTITLNEYGAATISSIKVRNFAFSDIDRNQADQVAYNMRNTLDALVGAKLILGDNVLRGGDATDTDELTTGDVITSTLARKAVRNLRSGAAPGRAGELYGAYVHPDVAYDLKAESGSGSWREAHVSAAPDLIWPNMIGQYEGAFWVETARMPTALDGATSAKVYRSVIVGKEALAEAVAIEPHVEVGVVPDRLNRFHPMGWYGLLGWSLFRQASIWRLETTATA